MTRTSLARRLAVGGVAVTVAAAGLALLAGPATAADTSRLILSQDQTSAAGTCQLFSISPVDAAGVRSTDTRTVTVRLTETPNSATQDVDFCNVPATTDAAGTAVPGTTAPDGGTARYTNAGTGMAPLTTAGSTQTYTPGPDLTPNPFETPTPAGNPDTADNTPTAVSPNNSNNPAGVDLASFTSVSGAVIRFGVVGLAPGAARIDAFVDMTSGIGGTTPANNAPDANEFPVQGTATFTEGGLPGSQGIADNAKSVDAEPETGAAQLGRVQTFAVTVTNRATGAGNTLSGVTPTIVVTSGPNATSTTTTAVCGRTNNNGVASCTYRGATHVGTDTLAVFVNQTGGTSGPDANEPRDDIQRTTTLVSVDRPEARFVELTPATGSTVAGQSKVFQVNVTSATTAPVRNVTLVLSSAGPGRFSPSGQGTVTLVTNDDGVATATVSTLATEAGTETLTASIVSPETTQCQQAAGAGNNATAATRAGNCSASAVNTIAPAASPSASPSASASASPSVSPSASVSPRPSVSATPTATATATASPSSTPAPFKPVVRLERGTITAQESVRVFATTAPGAIVQLLAYSRPSTTYKVVRQGVATQAGTIDFLVGPSGNTRLYVRTTDVSGMNEQTSNTAVLTVRTSINLKVTRTGTRTYRFTGSTLPKRVNQLVTVFYQQSGGSRVIAARARVAANGTYNVTRKFTANGTFTLFTATGTDINNAGNNSKSVRTAIR